MSDQTNAAIVSTVTTNHQTNIYFQTIISFLGCLLTKFLKIPPNHPLFIITSVQLGQIVFVISSDFLS